MDILLDEILLKIFGFFDIQTVHEVIAKVSPRWKKLALIPSLNRHITLTQGKETFLESLTTRFSIYSIKYILMDDELEEDLIKLSRLCPNVTRLHLTCSFNDKRIWTIISECFPHLKYLNAAYEPNDKQVETGCPSEFFDAVRNVEVVVMYGTISAYELDPIVNCGNLKELHLKTHIYPVVELDNLLTIRRDYMTKLTLTKVRPSTLEAIASCPNLKELRMYSCREVDPTRLQTRLVILHMTDLRVDEDQLNGFIDTYDSSALIDLNLSASAFSDRSAERLCRRKLRLRRLELNNCPNLTSEGVQHIITHLPSLVLLDVSTTLPDSVVEIAYELGRIRFLKYVDDNSERLYKHFRIYKDRIKLFHVYQQKRRIKCKDQGWSAALRVYDPRVNYLGNYEDYFDHIDD